MHRRAGIMGVVVFFISSDHWNRSGLTPLDGPREGSWGLECSTWVDNHVRVACFTDLIKTPGGNSSIKERAWL